MSGLTDNTLDEIDSHLRVLRRQLSALEAARRQLVGEPETRPHFIAEDGDGLESVERVLR